jgi:hypothetical protein
VPFDIPWYSENEKLNALRELAPDEYCSFGNTNTNVMAVIGEGTAFDPNRKRLSIHDFPNDLILIVEVNNTGVHWMQPGDLSVTELGIALSTSGNGIALGTSDDGFCVGFVDGEVWLLSHRTPPDILLRFCSLEFAVRYERESELAAYCVARSVPFWKESPKEVGD